MTINRNELIDPKFLLREGGRESLYYCNDDKHLNYIGSGHLLVRPTMLRSRPMEVELQPLEPEKLITACGVAGKALAAGSVEGLGLHYVVTDVARWNPPTYDHKKKKWSGATPSVILHAKNEPDSEVWLAEHYVVALWPWINDKSFYLTWSGNQYEPVILADSGHYPQAIVMPCRK